MDNVVDELGNILKSRSADIHQWSIRQLLTNREENYLIQDPKTIVALDQNRTVQDHQIWLGLWVRKDKGRIGHARGIIDLQGALESQVNAVLVKAHLTDEEFWVFPPPAEAKVQPKLCFDGFARDLEIGSQYFVDNCLRDIRSQKGATFNSAEIFISRIEEHYRLSSGFASSETKSRVYAEACFSAEDDRDSNEFLMTRLGRHPDQIQFGQLCERSVAGAKALLTAEPMPEGSYSVKVDGEVLGQLLNDATQWLRGERKYYRLPFMDEGVEFIPDFSGQSFSLTLDPTINFGLASGAFDEYGDTEKTLHLIESNRVRANIIDARIGQYLGRKATGNSGNLVLHAAGGLTAQDLSKTDHLDVWQFSALFSDAQSLTFSSEVRLAELVRSNGQRFFVKGGNLSGKFQENFNRIRFSAERNFVNLNDQAIGASLGFDGPKWGLLNNVSVSS